MATAAVNRAPKRPGLSDKAQERLAGFLFIAPAMLIVLVFIFIPILIAFYVSFTDWAQTRPFSEATFQGLQNYAELLLGKGMSSTQAQFFNGLRNTTWYTIIVVPTQTALSLLLAVIVNQKFLIGRGFFRTAFYFPSITASVVIGIVFIYIFSQNGVLNNVITALSGGTYKPITWLQNDCGISRSIFGPCTQIAKTMPTWLRTTEVLGSPLYRWIEGPSVTMFAIMLLAIWTTSSTMMLIFLAALQDIPVPLYEAASVDGATKWQQFRWITFPMLRPTTFFVVTIGLIGCFQVFDQIYVISKGAPAGTTSTIAYIAYSNAFDPSNSRAGLGAATAFVLFVIIALFTMLQRRIVKSQVET